MSQQLFVADFAKPQEKYIRRVSVRRLFDEFSYDLELSPVYGHRLGIVSGGNGTGKTTLLRLIRAALTPRPGMHKYFIYSIAFATFEIELVDGTRFGFERTSSATSGPFTYYLRMPSGSELTLPFNQINQPRMAPVDQDEDETGELTPENKVEEETVQKIVEIIRKRAPALAYLPTNRDLPRIPTREPVPRTTDPLRNSIDLFMRRLQIRARRESNDAEVVAYDVLARSIDAALVGEAETLTKQAVLLQFGDQMERIEAYAAFGLTTKVSADPIVEKIRGASDAQFATLAAMVRPYLESQKARLDALRDTYELVNQFISSLDQFLKPKSVTLSLLDNLKVLKRDKPLPLRALSSGERQLLRIFTSVTALNHPANLALVDEPELSLNSDWTRLLIRHLLSDTLTPRTQFLFATHSIELHAQFSDAILEIG